MSSAPLTDVELSVPSGAIAAGVRARAFLPGWPWILCATDTTMILAGSVLAAFGAPRAGATALPLGWTLLFAALTILFLWLGGLYRDRVQPRPLDDTARALAALTLAAGLIAFAELITTNTTDGSAFLREWAFAAVYVSAGRLALLWSSVNAHRAGLLAKPTLIVGSGRVGTLIAERLLARPELGLRPVAFLDNDPAPGSDALGIPVAGENWDLDGVIETFEVRQMIVAFSSAPDAALLGVLRRAEERGIPVAFVPRFFERIPEDVRIEHLGGISLLTPRRVSPSGWQFRVKYALDRVVGAVLLLLVAPLVLTAAIVVLLSMGRPVLYRQRRIGRDGKPFDILKFRSMRDPTESDQQRFELPAGMGPGGVEGVDRTTRVGRILRATNIDELPQLLNVARGEMSLVGPRPERPEYVARFESGVYRYSDRHRVKAGITGWAQVNGLRGRTSITDRAEWDNFYIENFSLRLDVKILLMTAAIVARSLLPRHS